MGRLLLALLLSLSLSRATIAAADVPREEEDRSQAGNDRGASAKGSAQERRSSFILAIAGVSVCLGGAGLFLLRRRRRLAASAGSVAAPKLSSLPRSPAQLEEPLLTKICPTCGERYANEAMLCGDDQTPLVLLN